jgi:hypothetical protein
MGGLEGVLTQLMEQHQPPNQPTARETLDSLPRRYQETLFKSNESPSGCSRNILCTWVLAGLQVEGPGFGFFRGDSDNGEVHLCFILSDLLFPLYVRCTQLTKQQKITYH